MRQSTSLMRLVIAAVMLLAANAAWATSNHYYGSILRISSNLSGAGKIYGIVGHVQSEYPVIGVVYNVNEDVILANGADDLYNVTAGNGVQGNTLLNGANITVDEDPTTGATIAYAVGVLPNAEYKFTGWYDTDGALLSTDPIADISLHTSAYLGEGRSAPANPKLNTEEYDIAITAMFEHTPTSVSGIEARPVASVKYVNLMGQTAAEPFEGINIVVTTYNDGTQSTAKVIK